ncbi:MAG: heme exporter protein CcmB [Candidatus Neomarinimicrobiota bacterium]
MFWILLKKELLIEFRSKEITISMLTFGMAIILTFSFAFNVSPQIFSNFAPGLFWIMILFVSVLGLHRSFSYEKEFDAFSLLISSPVDRGLIFFAKWISATLFISLMEILVVLPFFLFLGLQTPSSISGLFGTAVLCNAALMVVGSLVSGLAMRARLSEVLLPVLLFPLVSPVIIAAVKISSAQMAGDLFADWQIWLYIILSFIVIFGLVGFALFDHITEE